MIFFVYKIRWNLKSRARARPRQATTRFSTPRRHFRSKNSRNPDYLQPLFVFFFTHDCFVIRVHHFYRSHNGIGNATLQACQVAPAPLDCTKLPDHPIPGISFVRRNCVVTAQWPWECNVTTVWSSSGTPRSHRDLVTSQACQVAPVPLNRVVTLWRHKKLLKHSRSFE